MTIILITIIFILLITNVFLIIRNKNTLKELKYLKGQFDTLNSPHKLNKQPKEIVDKQNKKPINSIYYSVRDSGEIIRHK